MQAADTYHPQFHIVRFFGRLSQLYLAAARPVTGFSADQLARATSGLVLAAVCYQSLAPVGIAGRTVALYAILSGAADYRAGLALWLARGADCDVDERHRADRQSNLARSSGGFIALAAGAKSDRVVAWRWHPAVA